jgi:hypothetical protein
MYIYHTTSKRIGFDVINILLGELPLSEGNKIINLLIIYTKKKNFLSKMGKLPTFLELLFYLFNKYNVEKYIAHQNLEIMQFEDTWHVWKGIVNNMQNN